MAKTISFIPTTSTPTTTEFSSKETQDAITKLMRAMDEADKDVDLDAIEKAYEERYASMSELELAEEALQRSLERMERLKKIGAPKCILDNEKDLIKKRTAKVKYLKNKPTMTITKK